MESSRRPASGGGHVAWLEEAVEGGNDAEWELEGMLRTCSGFHTHVHMLALVVRNVKTRVMGGYSAT